MDDHETTPAVSEAHAMLASGVHYADSRWRQAVAALLDAASPNPRPSASEVVSKVREYAESLRPYDRPIAYAYQRADVVAAALLDISAEGRSNMLTTPFEPREAIRRFEWPSVSPDTVQVGDVVVPGTDDPAVVVGVSAEGPWVLCKGIGWVPTHRITTIYRHPDWRRPLGRQR